MARKTKTTVIYFKRNNRPYRTVIITKEGKILSQSGDFNPDIDTIISDEEYMALVREKTTTIKDAIDEINQKNNVVKEESDSLAAQIVSKLVGPTWTPLTEDEAHYLAYRILRNSGGQ